MHSSRRAFLQSAAAAPAFLQSLLSKPRIDTVRLASFGAGGMAWATLDGIATHKNVKLVAVAEVDSAQLKRLKSKYPDTRVYTDWREMLRKEKRNLDAACVGTPDHMHAPQAMSAMRDGLHVYVQKPLTHDIYEARQLAKYARKKRLVSQMGIQIHSASEYKTAIALIQSGAIGKVREVHTWSNKKWGDTEPLPTRTDPVPSTLDWDQWLGVAPARPYIQGVYHPGNWRKRIDFGTATFGDMGCHIFDPVFGALKLTSPLSVRSDGPAPSRESWAINAVIHYIFPATAYTTGPNVNIHWYDGDARPPAEIQALLGGARFPGQGSIFIGEKGNMLLPHIDFPTLLPGDQFKDARIERIEGNDHYHQFVDAILGKATTSTAFDYSGPLTESILLGPLATRFPQTTLNWNSRKIRFDNSKEASAFVRRNYREGWKIKGLS